MDPWCGYRIPDKELGTIVRYCSTPGCRREAKPDDTLCGIHRGGRTRSSNARAARPNRLAAPGIPEALRKAAFKDVLGKMDELGEHPMFFTNRYWLELREWLESQAA